MLLILTSGWGRSSIEYIVGISLNPDTYTVTNPMMIDKEWEDKMVNQIRKVLEEEAKDMSV